MQKRWPKWPNWFRKAGRMKEVFVVVLSGYMVSAWALIAQADSPDGWFGWVDKHGFTTVFAVAMLVLMVLATRHLFSFVKDRFDALENRCERLGERLDKVMDEDRHRLEQLVAENASASRDVADGLKEMAKRPCQVKGSA